jgi:hypothetical protein
VWRQAIPLTLTLLAASLTAALAQQAPAANPLNDLLMVQMNWDASKSDDNAKPTAMLKFVPYEKHTQDGKAFTSYYLYAVGSPQNTQYTLVSWQIGWGAEMPPMQPSYSGLYVNARGVVMCRKPSEREVDQDAPDLDSDARMNVIAAGSLGEPVRYALHNEKSGFAAMGRLVVHPIESEDKACRLQAILAVANGQIVLVEGTGFATQSTVEISRLNGGKPQTAKFKTDEKGRVETAVVLAKPDQKQGTSTITMKSDSCAPIVKVDWGEDSYHVR